MPVRSQSEASVADHRTVEALSRDHRNALVRYFEKRGIRGVEAEDAVQEVLVRLTRRAGLAEIERLDGYLFQTAASVAIDLHRHGAARLSGRHEPYDETLHARPDLSPADILEGREALALVLVGLKELPERTRHVFVLARLETLRQPEIARRLGISLSAVEKHLRMAVSHLAAKVERDL